MAKSANTLIKDATPQVKSILVSANKITDNLHEIIDGVQEGQGAVGVLFKDKELSDSIKRSAVKTESVVENLREATGSAKTIIKNVEGSDIVPEVQRAVKNLQQITRQIKDAVDKFESASGEGGVGENLQRTLADAHEAMSDLSDDTEALKHNFLFRGYFKKRGFYDLEGLTSSEYTSPSFAKGFKRHRIWLESADLFSKDGKGVEVLSIAGKAKLDEAMTEILRLPRNGPLMVEGFAGGSTASQQYLLGRRRAARVEAYLIGRFHLRPAYIGIISMGAGPADKGSTGPVQRRRGSCLVLQVGKAPRRTSKRSGQCRPLDRSHGGRTSLSDDRIRSSDWARSVPVDRRRLRPAKTTDPSHSM